MRLPVILLLGNFLSIGRGGEMNPHVRTGIGSRALNAIEWLGNRLPDPAVLFILVLLATWVLSICLASVSFAEIDPRTLANDPEFGPQPIRIHNQLTPQALVTFLTKIVENFTGFPPLGIVLVSILGVGVAEQTGLVNAVVKSLLALTPRKLLTPMVLLVAILSHTAGDTGYILVVPLGGVMFAAAGRHPLTGIIVAFAGVAGGFSANLLPSNLDVLLQGFTQLSARIIDPQATVNPLCNYFFMAASTLVIVFVGWAITAWVIEPRLQHVIVDGDARDAPRLEGLTRVEMHGLASAAVAVAVFLLLLGLAVWPQNSPFRLKGEVLGPTSPLMKSLVPLIFALFFLPGVAYGVVVGTVKSHRDVITAMSNSLRSMTYYMVLAFFAAQFTYAFNESNLGVLAAVKGANFVQSLNLPPQVTIVGIILIAAVADLFIGSASAKWALLGPVLVPMLMRLGISPELTQAAYRIGDSSSNVITPLMPYFPLVVMYCQRYVKGTGIGTLISLMLPYSLAFLVAWTGLLLFFWAAGIPLGFDALYTYRP